MVDRIGGQVLFFPAILFVHSQLQTSKSKMVLVSSRALLRGQIPLHLKSGLLGSEDVIGEIPTIISAKDIQQSLKFYRDVLGIRPGISLA